METKDQSIPRRIGRYDVVGRLATGGMAEILLGRLTGPSGFERPLVIKRILPHLARQSTFVHMFLDEGRIAAGVRHPNVVLHEELGREGDELFLVMEYLDGETLWSVIRRGRSRARPLDRGLAAYVVAEACAGLHAAHELVNAEGELQGLVHRDVSPHNVFVTYDGAVKLMDFGIAKVADRITSTEAGTVKGKFAYMSPEQARGETLDRRSDLFSLGVVLYELTTGYSLFRRRNQAATLTAVLRHEVTPPRELDPTYPPVLEGVCLRALAARPAERYSTALEMRRDLLEATRTMGCDPMPEEALAAHLAELFSDRLEAKHKLLRQFQQGESISSFPNPEVDESVELPLIRAEVSETSATTPIVSAERPRPGRRRPLWAVGALALIVAAVAGASLFVFGRDDRQGSSATQEEATVAAPPRPSPPEVPAANAHPSEEPSAVNREVTVAVDSTPSGAEVLVGDERRGLTPFELTLPEGDEPVELLLRKRGFVEVVERVVPSVDQRVSVHLSAASPRRSKRRSEAPPSAEAPASTERGFRRFD